MPQKQYSFDFVLNAVLNGGFSGTFSKAQQEFIRLGNEIKNLQTIQRDVQAYQKQDAAVQNTAAKLDNLRRQYELVNKQISETTGSTTALEREKLKLEQRISNTSAALEMQQNRLDSTKERLDAAGVSTSDLAKKDDELKAKIQELTEEQKKVTEEAEKYQSNGVQAIETVASAIAAAGVAKALGEIKDAYMECVETAGNFEQAMSAVEAISEASASEMAALTAEAKELGATTIYTAQQSANAMEYMAMAGWDASEMLAGMKGMTTLAAAAGEDLAQVSDIVTDNLTAFGMQASDTAHFADVLAAAAANSNTNISIMGETFKSSAAVAGALGYSVEDVAVMVGLMANSAVKGSRASTALRNIFDGLLDGVTLTAEAFGELEYSAIDSDGSMKGLMDTVQDLRGYFDQMTEAERVNNAMTIAGMRGYNGLLAILNATDEDFQSLYDSIYNCTGAAERMAAVKLDNLNGDLTIMQSAWEALKNTIGEQFIPEMRALYTTGTDVSNLLNQFVKDNPGAVKAGFAFVGVIGAATAALTAYAAIAKVVKVLDMATLFANPIFLAVAGVAALGAAVVGAVTAIDESTVSVKELTVAAREMYDVIEDGADAYDDAVTSTLAAANMADTYIDKLEEMGSYESLSNEERRRYHNTLELLCQTVPELAEHIDLENNAIQGGTDALRTNTEAWKENAKAQAYQEYLTLLYKQQADVLVEQEKNRIKLTEAEYALEEAQRKKDDIQARKAALYQEAEEAAAEYNKECQTLIETEDFLGQEYYELQDALSGVEQEIYAAQSAVDICKAAIEDGSAAAAAAEYEISQTERAINNLTGAFSDLSEEAQDMLIPLEDAAKQTANLAKSYIEAYQAAKESFSGQFGLFDEAKADADATVKAAQKALDTQLAYWQGYAANIASLKEISAEDLGVTQENYNALMAYVRSGTPEAAGLAADMVNKVNGGNTQALTDLANTLGEISESQDQAEKEMADWTSGLTEQMDQLITDMEENMGALDLSDEARKAAMSAIVAFIAEADKRLPDVQEAYARFGQAAAAAMGGTISPLYTKGYSLNDLTDSSSSPWPGPTPLEAVAAITGGYASGTDNAPPGWAWVGENGPELMRMRGGEQVLPSSVSRQVAEEYSIYSRYAAQGVQQTREPLEIKGSGTATASAAKMEMHFHIEAGAPPETVDAWQDYARRGELKAVVLEVMEDVDADMRRRAIT